MILVNGEKYFSLDNLSIMIMWCVRVWWCVNGNEQLVHLVLNIDKTFAMQGRRYVCHKSWDHRITILEGKKKKFLE